MAEEILITEYEAPRLEELLDWFERIENPGPHECNTLICGLKAILRIAPPLDDTDFIQCDTPLALDEEGNCVYPDIPEE